MTVKELNLHVRVKLVSKIHRKIVEIGIGIEGEKRKSKFVTNEKLP
jgi:hypothetical protein